MSRVMRTASRPFAIPAQRRNSHLLHLRLPPGRAWLVKGLLFLAFVALALRALSVPARIESVARGRLGMVPITPASSDYVSAAQWPGLRSTIPTD